jgi:hypothetical protein
VCLRQGHGNPLGIGTIALPIAFRSMDRTLAAYLLLALLLAALAALVAYQRHNSRDRRNRRQAERERESYRKVMDERSAGE